MRNVLIAIALGMSTTAPVAASDRTDVMEVVHRWTDAFGGGSFNTDIAPCSEDKAGKPVNFTGSLTLTLRQGKSGWRVSGVAWADQ